VPEFNRRLKEFEKYNTVVLGVSTDSVPTHIAWAQSLGGINYPLVADYNKTLAREYEVLMEDVGISLRGTFLIDPEGILQYININNTTIGRSVNEYLRVLAAMQTKKACPVNWEEGTPTL
jgi:peroxiredoxin 2/4